MSFSIKSTESSESTSSVKASTAQRTSSVVASSDLVMSNFREFFEVSLEQIESIFDVLEKDKVG